jgi:hypothetical protein
MVNNTTTKGMWIQTFGLFVLGAILAVLFFWFLGFVTHDIGNIEGPDRTAIRAKYVSANLDDTRTRLSKTIAETAATIVDKQQQQQIVRDGVQSLQNTINQLLAIQKLSVERGMDLAPGQLQTLNESQAAFLNQQNQYQALNTATATLTSQRQQLQQELTTADSEIAKAERQVDDEFRSLMAGHRWRLAALKLAVILPVFLLTTIVFIRIRSTAWWPIVYAVFLAAFARVGLVVHEYFPREYFKYIAILVVIAIVLKLIVHLVRAVIAPKRELLIRRYQEAYDRHRCPICAKPIRMGLLRYAPLGRRRQIIVVSPDPALTVQEPYNCPSCGTTLYEKCPGCNGTRHSLLPFCERCGKGKIPPDDRRAR